MALHSLECCNSETRMAAFWPYSVRILAGSALFCPDSVRIRVVLLGQAISPPFLLERLGHPVKKIPFLSALPLR